VIAARRKRRRTLSITSLIDVIFLLLLFFMLASTFQKFSELDVAAVSGASSPSTAPQDTSLTLLIEPNQVRLDNAAMELDRLVESLSAASPEPRQLSVRTAPGVSSQRLIDVLVALEPIADLNVNLETGA
jgi:biopolymer transport protein ExbD